MNNLKALDETRAQYRWAIANNVVALLCVVLALAAFSTGRIVAALLTLLVSVAAVINFDMHHRRGDRVNVRVIFLGTTSHIRYYL